MSAVVPAPAPSSNALRPHHQIKVRHSLEKLLSPALGHASHETKDDMSPLISVLPHYPHFAQSLLLGLIPDTAGIDQYSIRIMFARRQSITTFGKCLSNLLRITLVHLSSVSLDKYLGHTLP